jgi:hypothetical protein
MLRFPFASVEVPDAPPARAVPLDPALREELLVDVDEEGQVTVHCLFEASLGDAIRIWPTTYLVCQRTGHRSRLIHAEGISYAPVWTFLAPGQRILFTLLFEPLPRGCAVFDLVEDIADEGAFLSSGIVRNGMDVYRVRV